MDLGPLLNHPAVERARARIRELDPETLAEQVELAAIPAPSGSETARGARVRARFEALGLERIATDEVGNVHGWLAAPDAGGAEPPLLVTAHLDTVFAADTDLTVRRDGERIMVPGIADNARGMAALLTLARVLAEAPLPTRRRICFVATVGEEGAGDLRGVKHLFRPGSPFRDAAGFVSIDGSGLRRVVHRAVGSRRLRVSIRGVGGHSWADWGIPNPLHALGAAIGAVAAIPLPSAERTTLTVARAGGGTSINAIPEAAWMEMDLRSEGSAPLDALERAVRERVEAAARAEGGGNGRRGPALSCEWTTIGDRPGGTAPATDPLVAAAVAATRALGVDPELVSSSTDSNVPISLGVPAVTVGAGGESGGIHTTDEWYANVGGPAGVERALLLVLAAAGVR